MIFIPSKSKFKKQQKGRSIRRINKNVVFFQLTAGRIGLQSVSSGRLSSVELKTLRQSLNKTLKKRANILIKTFPDKPITKKPLEIRMGKGKGAVNHWVSQIKPGTLLVEIETKFMISAIKALKLVQIRLSLKTKIIFS